MIIKKIICFILGHKYPDDDRPLIKYTSGLMGKYHYSWSRMPCERCISYELNEKYTPEEFKVIAEEALEQFLKDIEKQNKIVIDEINKELTSAINTESKMIH